MEVPRESMRECLKEFSDNANKHLHCLLPEDSRAWMKLIVFSHENKYEITPTETEIKSWLLEDGWAERTAAMLSKQYGMGRELLSYRDKVEKK